MIETTYNITSAKYVKNPVTGENVAIQAVVDGRHLSFMMADNGKYWEAVKEQVEAGTLTIEDAD